MIILKRIPRLTAVILGLLFLVRLSAEDNPLEYERLDLTDGRKLTKVVVKNYDPESGRILLMAKKTAMKIPIDLLPEAIRDRVKTAAPKAGGSTTTTASAPPTPESERRPPQQPMRFAQPEPRVDPSAHRQAALARAQNYYRYEFPAGSGAIRVTAANFEVDDPEEVPGWPGRYRLQGKVFLEFFDSKGYSYSRTTDRFDILTEQKSGASIKVVDFSRK